ncbi:MAG: putative lipopolysaccharide heptosyltransferase III [Bacteroidetes bacterium]|nr:putative lipopolysaccharide heptosyltransferase III [Bacteroidota bacterium]
MKILITKFRSVGDVILLTPLIRNLKISYPDSEIDLMVNKGTEVLVSHNPNIHHIILHDRFKLRTMSIWQRIKTEFRTLRGIRKNHYNIVISSDRGDRGAQIAYFSNAEIRIGRSGGKGYINKNAFMHYFSFQGERHIVDLNLDPLRLLDLPINDKGLDVYCSSKDNDKARKIVKDAGKFIHIHPVSQCMYKCIDDKVMAQIIDYCELELKTKVVLTAAPVDQELARVVNILKYTKSKPINLSGKLTLLETAALNKLTQMLIVVDTAIMHIATANDVPVLAFFGPTAVDNWGPWDKTLAKTTYQRKGGLQQHGKHTVLMDNRGCVPCSQTGCDNSGVSNCLNAINLDTIKEKINIILNEQSN